MRHLLDLLTLLSLVTFLVVMAAIIETGLSLPLAGLATLFVLLPAWQFVSYRRQEAEKLRRINNGLCIECGYDLRSNTDHCPECGREFKPYEKMKLFWGEGEGGADGKL